MEFPPRKISRVTMITNQKGIIQHKDSIRTYTRVNYDDDSAYKDESSDNSPMSHSQGPRKNPDDELDAI